MRSCWCGNADLVHYAPEYGECLVCGTLVYLKDLPPEELLVRSDETDFYGKRYWLEHQREAFGNSDIYARARNDLSERNLHWLKILMKYRLPPARVLELGCAHGSFVALLQHAGYDAAGIEMSPWVVEFGKKTFGVPISVGPVESLGIPPGGIDIIVLMDVLEHLPDPTATMAHCLQLLKPNGLLLIQTPQFKEGTNHSTLVETKAPFLEMLIPGEHIYLFSDRSVTSLFQRLGAAHFRFEPAIFSHYDMFFTVSRISLQANLPEQVDAALLTTPDKRLILALLDLRKREEESYADRVARGEQIESLTAMIETSEANRNDRALQIETLSAMLKTSEEDRAARAKQIESLSTMFRNAETDLNERSKQIEALSAMLKLSEEDRAARSKQIESLSTMLKDSETDRAARAKQIESLSTMLKDSEADRAARARQIESLTVELRALFARPGIRLLTKVSRLPEIQALEQFLTHQHILLKTIAVDLTPVLPGGGNGGAKIFALELLRQLSVMKPQTQFVMLTHAASHADLAFLDGPNLRRLMIVDPHDEQSLRRHERGFVSRMLAHAPGRLQNVLSLAGAKLKLLLRRDGSGALLRTLGADLLFCPFTAPTYSEQGIPTVCTIYDLQYKTYPEFFRADDVAHRDRVFIDACRRATALTAISDYSRDSAILHGKIDPERVRTIHLRMARRIPQKTGADLGNGILKQHGLLPHRYLIYPANFWKHKNHEMLLTAFGLACHGALPGDIKLVCTGAPDERQADMIGAARTMKLGDRALFPGYLPDADLAALISNSCGMVFPSLYEGFGLPVIEAMTAGVPVACSNVTSLPEVASDAALLFDPRNPDQIAHAMVSLVEDAPLRVRLIDAGKQRAAEFSDTERMAREYWELFQYALANEKQEDLLTGAYADGWAGPTLNLQVAPSAGTQFVELEFSAPEWLPRPKCIVQARRKGRALGAPLEVVRGAHAVLSLTVEPSGGRYEIQIAPAFVPARTGIGNDRRDLTTILLRCSIDRGNAGRIELFPEKVGI